MSDKTLSFDKLVENVESVHAVTSSTAKGAVNKLLTVRNWAIPLIDIWQSTEVKKLRAALNSAAKEIRSRTEK